jgi:hypothetical protein
MTKPKPRSRPLNFVTSPVEDCDPSAEKIITSINFTEVKDDYAKFDVGIREQGFGHPDGFIAPLPISILWGMKKLARQPQVAITEAGRTILKVCKDLPSPLEYMQTYGQSFSGVRREKLEE